MDVTITEYHDYYSEWYGLEDGTLLQLDDERGEFWRKVDGKTEKRSGYLNL